MGGLSGTGTTNVRAALTEQNLPGLSIAVGIDTDIVWAEDSAGPISKIAALPNDFISPQLSREPASGETQCDTLSG